MIQLIKKIVHKIWVPPAVLPVGDRFLKGCNGVIHIGANTGQERELYASFNLNVAWFEPIPEVFNRLQSNLSVFPKQKAYNYLLANEDGLQIRLNISSNGGESSSIFRFKGHKEIWEDIDFISSIECQSITLPKVIEKEKIALRDFDVLILDTQGSELLILQGAKPVLRNFRFIKTEVSDFESYEGACTLLDLSSWVREAGFELISKNAFISKKGIGTYYDVVFKRR